MIKKRILVIFGGQSSEHIVSCMSAVNVINNIDRDTYDVLIVGITEEGHWLLVDSVEAIQDESWRDGTVQAVLSPDATEKSVIVIDGGRNKENQGRWCISRAAWSLWGRWYNPGTF